MEEFDLNFDNNIGTSVSKLKNNIDNKSETEIDYDKILDKLDITETNDVKYDIKLNLNERPNNINMNHFARKLENKLDNIKKERNQEMFVDVKHPSVDSIKLAQKELKPSIKPSTKPSTNPSTNPSTKPSNPIRESVEEQISNRFEHKEIIIYVILFIILNSKILIEIIYDKISITRDNPYPNLIIRALLFGSLLFLIKKLNLNS
jgi:hypothetical protein